MTLAIVITLVVFLAGALVIAVARDPGATPADVALGYGHALAHRDFDAMYRMTDPEVVQNRNRAQWIAERAGGTSLAIDATALAVVNAVVNAETARVIVGTDHTGGTATVELACRQRIWCVSTFTASSPLAVSPPVAGPPVG